MFKAKLGDFQLSKYVGKKKFKTTKIELYFKNQFAKTSKAAKCKLHENLY